VSWLAGVRGFLILTFYSVIAGMVLEILSVLYSGDFKKRDNSGWCGVMFGDLLSKIQREMLLWHSVFMALVVLTVGQSCYPWIVRSVVKFYLLPTFSGEF